MDYKTYKAYVSQEDYPNRKKCVLVTNPHTPRERGKVFRGSIYVLTN